LFTQKSMLKDASDKNRCLHQSTTTSTQSSNFPRRRRKVTIESSDQIIPCSTSNVKEKKVLVDCNVNKERKRNRKENLISSVDSYQEANEIVKASVARNEKLRCDESHQRLNSDHALFRFSESKKDAPCISSSVPLLISHMKSRSTLSLSSASSRRSCSFGDDVSENREEQANFSTKRVNLSAISSLDSDDAPSSDLVLSTADVQQLRAETQTFSYHPSKSGLKVSSNHIIWITHVLLALSVIVMGYYNNQTLGPRYA
jgi:hypothetical protein